jgi:hypothetical protein
MIILTSAPLGVSIERVIILFSIKCDMPTANNDEAYDIDADGTGRYWLDKMLAINHDCA